MRKTCTFLILLTALSPLFAQEKRESGEAMIYGSVVNIRETPTATGKIIGQTTIGTLVLIRAASEEKVAVGVHKDFWYEIKTPDGKIGHVYGAYIAIRTTDLGDGKMLLLGASDKKKGQFEFRILQAGKIIVSGDFQMLGYGATEEGKNIFTKFEIHKDFFGPGHHVLELGSFAGIEACAMFTSGAYIFSIKDKSIALISEGAGGADAPVSSDTSYAFAPGVITETREHIEDQNDNGPVGSRERRTFRVVKGKIQASQVEKFKIGKK